jgi:hypothetical protein
MQGRLQGETVEGLSLEGGREGKVAGRDLALFELSWARRSIRLDVEGR